MINFLTFLLYFFFYFLTSVEAILKESQVLQTNKTEAT